MIGRWFMGTYNDENNYIDSAVPSEIAMDDTVATGKKEKQRLPNKIIIIFLLVLFILIGLVLVLLIVHKKAGSQDGVPLKNIIVENNSYQPSFSPNIYDYYLLTSDQEINIKCDVIDKEKVSGCDTKIDLSKYSDYIHEIVVDSDNEKTIYKLYIKVRSSDSDRNIVINSIDGIPANWTNQNASITINATSENSIEEYSIDNGRHYQKSNRFTISDNSTLEIVVKDRYGNETAVRTEKIEKIDKDSPEGIIIKETSTSDSITLKVVAKDEESGIDGFSWDGNKYSDKDTLVVKEKGNYYVNIRDKAGNEKKVSIEIKNSDFTSHQQFYVKLYKNGSDSIDNSFLSCTKKDDGCVVTLPNIGRAGAEIIGWSTNKDDTEALYNVGEKIRLRDNLELYAVTKKELVAKFQQNDGEVIRQKCVLYNAERFCYITVPDISSSNGKIIGWNNYYDATTVLASPQSLIALDTDTTYYALVFRELIAYFDKNGASSISSTKEECRMLHNEVVCQVLTPKIKRDDAEILGWSTNKNDTMGEFDVETLMDISKNTTYYAITKKNVVVNFETNGADRLSASAVDCDIYNAEKSCNITTPQIYRKDSDIFGWSVNKSSHTGDIKEEIELSVTNNRTYYAITKKNVNVKYYLNGADSISAESDNCSFYNDEGGCRITTPKINRLQWQVLGWNTKSSAHEATVKVNSEVVLENSVKYYAITTKVLTARFLKNNADSLGGCSKITPDGCSATCDVYNDENGCYVSLPYIYSLGNEVIFFSTSSDPTTKVGYSPASSLRIMSNISLNAIVDNRYRKETLRIAKSQNYGYTAFETDLDCPVEVYTNYYNFVDRLYEKAPYIFTAAKVTFMGNDNFSKTWGNYAGMTYGLAIGYRNVDVKCPTKYSNYYLHTIVHELTHSWNSYYRAVWGKYITDDLDFIRLYNKYANDSNRPLRDYSYTNINEFLADVYAWYYFLYIDTSEQPDVVLNSSYYPKDMKNTIEKYIRISQNGY